MIYRICYSNRIGNPCKVDIEAATVSDAHKWFRKTHTLHDRIESIRAIGQGMEQNSKEGAKE